MLATVCLAGSLVGCRSPHALVGRACRDHDCHSSPRSQPGDSVPSPWRDLEAVRAFGQDAVLVAGRTPHGSQVWQCAALSRPASCRDITPPGMRPDEDVDDIDIDQLGDVWLLTHVAALDRGWVRTSHDDGRSWSARRPVPTHNDSAGSKGRIVALGPRSAEVTQSDANGPLAWAFLTRNGGRSWQLVLRTHA